MLPIMLVSSSRDAADAYVQDRARLHAIHPSALLRVVPENTTIAIEQIREVNAYVSRSSSPTMIVIFDFHTAKDEAQNALLKTLEEHPAHAHLIIVVRDDSDVLPTIRSRSHVVILNIPDTSLNGGQSTHIAPDPLMAAHGLFAPDMNIASWMAATAFVSKADAPALLIELSEHFRSRMKGAGIPLDSYTAIQSELIRLYGLLTKNNVNHEGILDAVGRALHQHGLLPLPR